MIKILGIAFIGLLLSLPSLGQRRGAASKETVVQAPSSSSRKLNPLPKSSPQSTLDPTITLSMGVGTSTNSGIFGGLTFRNAWVKNPVSQAVIGLDLSIIKDYREFDSPYSYNGRGYIEGKLNNLLVIRPEYGRQWTLFKKSNEGGASLKGILLTGPNFGMQMPYHVDISAVNPSTGKSSIQSIPMAQALTNPSRTVIIGESSYFNGMSESVIVPGWHVKTAFNVELDTFKQNYLSLEMGFIVDYFSKPIEMLNQTPHRSVYTTGYLTFFFGKSK
jgi:hypothetical protein